MDERLASATEILRRLLDERGVEYFKHEDGEPLRKLEKADEPATSWHMGGASVCAVPIEGSDLFDLWIDHCTPEQAIAATLGSGKLTAEQVQAVIFAHSSCAGRENGEYFANDIRMQAIADELNATLGGGECVPHGEWESISQTQEVRHIFCECGHELGMDRRDSLPFHRTSLCSIPNYCEECGRKIRKATIGELAKTD